MERNFLVFLFVTAACLCGAVGRAEWSPIPIQRRTDHNYGSENYAVFSSPATEDQSKGQSSSEESKEATTGESGESESEDEETTTEAAPFIWTDIKVPPSFLRIEYMIGYSFMGLMYGLGFLTFFQSLVVPTAKFLTAFVYIVFVTQGLMDPITLQDALQQVSPN